MKCWICGKEMENTIGGCYKCRDCGVEVNDLVMRYRKPVVDAVSYEEGWVCPKCGSVMSPTQPYCLFCCSCHNTPVSITAVWNSDGTNIKI